MNTSISTLLNILSNQKSKTDYMNSVDAELDAAVAEMQGMGFKVDKHHGLIGAQTFPTVHSLMVFHYFRHVHYIYHLLLGTSPPLDKADQLYFIGIGGFAQAQYNVLP